MLRRGVQAKVAAAAIVLLVVAAAAAFILTRQGSNTTTPAGPEAGVIKIGFTYTATGPGAEIGEEYKNGALAWWKWVNQSGGILVGGKRYQVKLVFYDDKGDAGEVVKAYKSLVENDYVDFLIGPALTELQKPAMDVAENHSKIIIVATHDDSVFRWGYRYSYQVATPTSKFASPALAMLEKLDPNITSVALVFEDTPYTRAIAQSVKSWASLRDVQVVFEYYYAPGTTEFDRVARALLQAAPDVIIGGGGVAETAALAKAIRESSVSAKAVILLNGDSQEMLDSLGDSVQGIMAIIDWMPTASYSPFIANELGLEWYGPTVTDFDTLYQSMFGKLPGDAAARAFAALLTLQYAIETAGDVNTVKVAQVLDGAKIMIFYGPIQFDTNPETHGRQVLHETLVGQWQYDQNTGKYEVKIVAPPIFANAQPIYPLP